jgi:proline iminopeptidase
LDVTARLKTLTVPTLVIGAKYDTMDPKHMEWMSKEVQNGTFYCAQMEVTQYDDQKIYFKGLIEFLRDVDKGTLKKGNSIARILLKLSSCRRFLVFD